MYISAKRKLGEAATKAPKASKAKRKLQEAAVKAPKAAWKLLEAQQSKQETKVQAPGSMKVSNRRKAQPRRVRAPKRRKTQPGRGRASKRWTANARKPQTVAAMDLVIKNVGTDGGDDRTE